jgi:lipoyl(octanoyl) transferase
MDSNKDLRIAWLGTVEYRRALKLLDALVEARHTGAICDTLLLLEHPHVYTLGRGAAERYLVAPPADIPVYRVSRGGQVTYHGPGQLICYPILKLEGPDRDVHAYLRALEEVIIRTLDEYGIEADRRVGLTGAWVGRRKIASIGVGIRRWTTLHGLALNITTDLRFFDFIVPCGIEGCRITSIAGQGCPEATTATAAPWLISHFAAVFGYPSPQRVNAAEIWNKLSLSPASEFEADRG